MSASNSALQARACSRASTGGRGPDFQNRPWWTISICAPASAARAEQLERGADAGDDPWSPRRRRAPAARSAARPGRRRPRAGRCRRPTISSRPAIGGERTAQWVGWSHHPTRCGGPRRAQCFRGMEERVSLASRLDGSPPGRRRARCSGRLHAHGHGRSARADPCAQLDDAVLIFELDRLMYDIEIDAQQRWLRRLMALRRLLRPARRSAEERAARPRRLCDNPRLSGAWRSLVARTVRVGEVPSSNLGAPIPRPGGGNGVCARIVTRPLPWPRRGRT